MVNSSKICIVHRNLCEWINHHHLNRNGWIHASMHCALIVNFSTKVFGYSCLRLHNPIFNFFLLLLVSIYSFSFVHSFCECFVSLFIRSSSHRIAWHGMAWHTNIACDTLPAERCNRGPLNDDNINSNSRNSLWVSEWVCVRALLWREWKTVSFGNGWSDNIARHNISQNFYRMNILNWYVMVFSMDFGCIQRNSIISSINLKTALLLVCIHNWEMWWWWRWYCCFNSSCNSERMDQIYL